MSVSPAFWDELVKVGDPGLGQTITLLHPVLSITFYLRFIDYGGVRQLYDEAMKLMQPDLTHYTAETMKRPAKITPRALGMIPAWMQKPKEDHSYWWRANGGSDLGCAPPGFDFFLWATGIPPAEKKLRMVQAAIRNYGEGEISGYVFSSTVRLILPVDHPLADASTLLAWLRSLELLRSGHFEFVECSYGLSSLTHLDHYETQAREAAACSRYPGLDCFRHSQAGQVRADASYPDLIPLVKRAAWTMVLQELTVQALGGEAIIREQLATVPEIRVSSLEHGLILQAGDHPALGDLNRGDGLPLLRKIAAVIRPVRVTKLVEELAEQDEFWAHFFNIFDKDYT